MSEAAGADKHALETLLVKMMGNLARATAENAQLLKQAFPYLSASEFETAYGASNLTKTITDAAPAKRVRKRKQAGTAENGAPLKQKRQPTGYILFCNDLRSELKGDGVARQAKEVMTELARRWKSLPDEVRQTWNDKAKADAEAANHEAAPAPTAATPRAVPSPAKAAPSLSASDDEDKKKKHKKDKKHKDKKHKDKI